MRWIIFFKNVKIFGSVWLYQYREQSYKTKIHFVVQCCKIIKATAFQWSQQTDNKSIVVIKSIIYFHTIHHNTRFLVDMYQKFT